METILEKNLSPAQKEELAKLIKSGKIKTSKDLKNWQSSKKKAVSEEELTEAYVPSNIKDFAKRKGVLPLVNKVAGWAEGVGKKIVGGVAVGRDYDTLVLDMTYQEGEIRINYLDDENPQIELYDKPVRSFNAFEKVFNDYNKKKDNSLTERIAEAFNKIYEELCPAGKAYVEKRKKPKSEGGGGEKHSAYLMGRASKICKGQMSGKAKKK